MNSSVLVIGGGIAGIQASLDLAKAGVKVVLVERAASIGGKMAVLDKNFPTLDCSICIEAPKMSEVSQNKNIELLSLSRVEKLEGEAGNFTATIRSRSRFVTDECTRCADCVAACPVVLGNEFDSSMAYRKAIHTPLAQSVPGAYVVDIDNCLNDPPNYLACQRCVEVCKPKCITFDMPGEAVVTRRVSSVIVAAGYDLINPEAVAEYGYGTHPDIVTSMELERLLTSAGPTGGEIVRPSNGKPPQRALVVLCVGSRDRRLYPHCSRFCCMYSVKHAFQLKDHGVDEVTVLYMDARAYGKGFDEFWSRTEGSGVKFVRGRPASVAPGPDGALTVTYEDTGSGRVVRESYDLAVLATAVTPPKGVKALADSVGLALGPDGFIRSVPGTGDLLHTERRGVYVAGCASGPKDIPDSVSEGSAAAALALAHVPERSWPVEEKVEPIPDVEEPRIGVFVCHCGSNIAGVVDVNAVAEFSKSLPGVVHAQTQMFSCAGNTQHEIEAVIRDKKLSRVVVAACSPKTHEATFKQVCRRAGLNPYLLEMANIRNQDSWVHKESREQATAKAADLIAMSVEKARSLMPLEEIIQPVVQQALVVGGGAAGMAAAAALARQGYPTHLVEREPELGGRLRRLERLAPDGEPASDLLAALKRELDATGVAVHAGAEVESAGGHVGNFHARLTDGSDLNVGAIVLATGAVPYEPKEFGHGGNPRVVTNVEYEGLFAKPGDAPRNVTFVGCIGSRQGDQGCSRYCCTSMIQQALALRRAGKSVRVLSRDIRTYSRGAEELYEEAGRTGVQFFRYSGAKPVEEVIAFEDGWVRFHDELLGRDIEFPTDLLVLAVGLRPVKDALVEQLKLARSRDGFMLELHPKLGPAETACQGVYLAGTVQAPKDVREAIAQALAAAGKASTLLAKDRIEKEPLMAKVHADKCAGCMACVKVCPFNAIEQLGKVREGKVKIIEAACQGCGTCAAQCNFDAIEMPFFTAPQVLAQIDAALAEKPEEKVLVFACNWCSYAGADQAGIEKIQYPGSSRIIRTMCSARVEQRFVNRAFERGAGAVVVTGCRLTDKGSDCHYNYANQNTLKRFKMWKMALQRKGIADERFQLQWISASEGKEFAAKMREMDGIVKTYARSSAERPAMAAS